MILLLDNYDSFTYNIYQYVSQLGAEVVVKKNDELTLTDVARLNLDGIIISPGPGRPQEAGLSLDLIREYGGQKPLLGVCLGHQAIGVVYGARVVEAPEVMHGKVSEIRHDNSQLFNGIANPFRAARYNSLVIEPLSFPEEELEVTAWSEDKSIMALGHRRYKNLLGVQFHPEAILSEAGLKLFGNFLEFCG